tara:strand:+ start:220 stop:1245 length:1026 start_codon:yes stop_codon:yes gene_type:complete
MSQQSFLATNGTGGNIPFSIDSFSEDEIKVYVDGVLFIPGSSNQYTIPDYTNTGGTVTWEGTVPTSSNKIRIVRQTDVLNNGHTAVEGKATYTAGSSVRAADLNNNTKQALRAIQEQQDQKIQTYDIEDDAVTAAKLADLSVSNANVTANAAIDGTKINPDFGSQSITTTGTSTVGHLTATDEFVAATLNGQVNIVHHSPTLLFVENLNTGDVIGVAEIQLNNDNLDFRLKGNATSAAANLGSHANDYLSFLDTQSGITRIDIKKPVTFQHFGGGTTFTETAAIDTATGNISTTGTVRFANLTTTERDASYGGTGIDGSVIFNTTTNKLQVKVGSSWIDLH